MANIFSRWFGGGETKSADLGTGSNQTTGVTGAASAASFIGFLQDQDNWDISFAVLIEYVQRCSPFADAVGIIADAVADIKPRVFDKQAGEYVENHPLIDLLEYPNSGMDRTDFMRHLASMYCITGSPLLRSLGPHNRPPVGLDVDSPQHADIQPDRVGDIGVIKMASDFHNATYRAEMVDGRARYRAAGDLEIWPLFGFNPKRGSRKFFATPIAKPLYYEIEQYINAGLHNKSMLKRAARPGGMFSSTRPEDLTDEQFQRLQDQVNMYFSGPNNAGRPMLGENLKFEPMIVSNRDMDYAAMSQNVTVAIYRQFRIPLPLITASTMTYSNFETAQVALYDRAVLPMTRFIYGQLTQALMYRFGKDWRRYDLRYDETDIPALQIRRAEMVKLRKQIGVNTVNEMRLSLGDEPIDGGDIILRPASEVPALDGATDAPSKDDTTDKDEASKKAIASVIEGGNLPR